MRIKFRTQSKKILRLFEDINKDQISFFSAEFLWYDD